ncbi:hypothetical protein HpNP52_15350 [Helicobacter pylori]
MKKPENNNAQRDFFKKIKSEYKPLSSSFKIAAFKMSALKDKIRF